ncbi:MAG: helix-turn-helix domain-containing protein [Lentisphaeria bacterium]|nr:helix-turn-helix domain-containing protein [Lentisphaeria bacterium]
MKHVLCALQEPNELLLRHIHEFGRDHGWLIERSTAIPKHWSGDGIITDYFELRELAVVDRLEKTPVVSRLLSPAGNVRTIRPDTTLIASMIVSYFTAKGFTRFAMLTAWVNDEMIDGKPRDILTAVRNELAGRNLALHHHLLPKPDLLHPADYRELRRKLRKFFAAQEKPFALILSSGRTLALVYRVLEEMRLRVPEEVAILVNTDDWTVTENTPIPTSYIGGEFRELGSKMAELLDRMMSGEEVPEKMIYASSAGVVSRRSTDTLAVSDLRLAGAVSFLLQNYMNFISVGDAARAAGLSQGMLIRLFHREFGKSPLRFLQEIRFNRIRHLLDSTDLPLSEIARQCGYGSDMALSVAFRRETGIPPGLYRSSRRHMP